MPDTSKQAVPRWSQTTPCDICGLLIGVAGLKKHLKNHELDNVDPADLIHCPYRPCPYRMKAKQINHLYPHIRSEHTKVPLVCPICPDHWQTFHDSAFSRHFRTLHKGVKKPTCWAPPMPKPFVCPACKNWQTHNDQAFIGHWKNRHPKMDFPHEILQRQEEFTMSSADDVDLPDDEEGSYEGSDTYSSEMDVSVMDHQPPAPVPRSPSPFEGWSSSFGFNGQTLPPPRSSMTRGPTLPPLRADTSGRRSSMPLPSFASMFATDSLAHSRNGSRKISMPNPLLMTRTSHLPLKVEE